MTFTSSLTLNTLCGYQYDREKSSICTTHAANIDKSTVGFNSAHCTHYNLANFQRRFILRSTNALRWLRTRSQTFVYLQKFQRQFFLPTFFLLASRLNESRIKPRNPSPAPTLHWWQKLQNAQWHLSVCSCRTCLKPAYILSGGSKALSIFIFISKNEEFPRFHWIVKLLPLSTRLIDYLNWNISCCFSTNVNQSAFLCSIPNTVPATVSPGLKW